MNHTDVILYESHRRDTIFMAQTGYYMNHTDVILYESHRHDTIKSHRRDTTGYFRINDIFKILIAQRHFKSKVEKTT